LKKIVDRFFMPIQYVILYSFNFIFSFKYKPSYSFVIGVEEIANCTYYLNRAFKNKSVSVNFTTNKFYKSNKYDYSISIENRYLAYFARMFYGPYLLAKLSNQADVFIYFWWTGFCNDREIEYKFLKYKKKKIVCIFVGDDIRSRKLLKERLVKENLDSYVYYDNYDVDKNEMRVKKVAFLSDTYADLAFSVKKSQVSYLEHYVNTFMYMIDDNLLDNCKFVVNDNKRIKIVHAPSNPILKGTPLVKAAIKKLELEGYNFEYIELINKSNAEVLSILNDSNIVLNQFYADMPGVFGIEAMAKKNAVLMSADYDNLPTNGQKPWIRTQYWEVYDNLKYLLDNPEIIREYADAGYEFVKHNYAEDKVREFYIDTFYEHKIIDDKSIFKK